MKSLYLNTFNDTEEFADFLEKSAIKIFTRKVGEEVVSVAYALDKKISLVGRGFNALHLVGLATKEDFRGKGYMSGILAEVEKYARENNYSLLSLFPAISGFYERLGFAYLYRAEVLKVSGNGTLKLKDATVEELHKIYAEIPHGTAYSVRDGKEWERLVTGYTLSGEKIKLITDGDTVGYVVYDDVRIAEYGIKNGYSLDSVGELFGKEYVASGQGECGVMIKPLDTEAQRAFCEVVGKDKVIGLQDSYI